MLEQLHENYETIYYDLKELKDPRLDTIISNLATYNDELYSEYENQRNTNAIELENANLKALLHTLLDTLPQNELFELKLQYPKIICEILYKIAWQITKLMIYYNKSKGEIILWSKAM